jgi:hypothetical protein
MWRLALVLPLLALTACSDSAEGEGGCAAVIRWEGLQTPRGARLGEGEVPPCHDGGASDERAQPVEVWRVRGVAPRLAVAQEDGSLSLAPGYFVALPSHPLHDRFYESAREPAKPGDGRRCRVSGRVLAPTSSQLATIRTARGRELDVVIDARTRFDGLRRAGHPHLDEGQAIHVEARRCRPRHVTAMRISPAG